MTVEARGDILFVNTNDIELKIGKSNHLILNPEAITDTFNIQLPSTSITLEDLEREAGASGIRAFRSFVYNVVNAVKKYETPVEAPKPIEEPKVITVTRTVVERETNLDRLAIYSKLSASFKVMTFLLAVVLIVCVIALIAMKPKIDLR